MKTWAPFCLARIPSTPRPISPTPAGWTARRSTSTSRSRSRAPEHLNTRRSPMIQQAIGLTPTEVEQFRRDGYLVCHRQLFPEPKFRRLQETFERVLANAPAGKKPEDLDVPHYAYPELFEWLLADEALD